MKTFVILADGEFPKRRQLLEILVSSSGIICCDGAAAALIEKGYTPIAIVGDMDSLDKKFQEKYRGMIYHNPDQETNDLTKAFKYTLSLSPDQIYILGATGLREDHTIGNVSLLALYRDMTDIPVRILTDHGIFTCIEGEAVIETSIGAQISIFALDKETKIVSEGLKYPLKEVIFDSWWKGTLNEATLDSVKLNIDKGKAIVFQAY